MVLRKIRFLAGITALLLVMLAIPALAGNGDTLVSVGSPDTPFPQNKQNEPAVAIDPSNPNVVVAGANDEIDLEPCVGSSCPFTAGVGVSGIYFSDDRGATWTQPTYTGYSARSGTPGPGPIGTLPNYFENGLVSDGDPILAFGPQPGTDGDFSWSNGSRLYYSNLTSNFSTERDEGVFRGFEAIAVSHADNLAAAADGDASAWSDPVVVAAKRQSRTTFSDKENLWADNAASSPHFGNVYVCWVSFRSNGLGGAPEPLMFSRSIDGGDNFSNPKQVTAAVNNNVNNGRQGCLVRTDSQGTVYVFWEGSVKKQSVQLMARSFDGGVSFEKALAVASVVDVGGFDPVQGRLTFDGVAGARTNSFPSVDIANGAPTGNGPDTIVMVWSDARNGLNDEEALLQASTDGGETWSAPVNAADANDRPDFPWVAISPNGEDVYVTYNGFLDPWRDNLDESRHFQGVVRHADFPGLSFLTVHRGGIGDGRASSANSQAVEFLGDYNFVDATNDFASAVWIDARNAAICPETNAFRAGLAGLGQFVPPPAPATDCPATFGNTDIFGILIDDPTP
jgi:hypothetical protein